MTADQYITIAILALTFALLINGMPFAITVMVGASCSFISPMGYQTNLMVYWPGGYQFKGYRNGIASKCTKPIFSRSSVLSTGFHCQSELQRQGHGCRELIITHVG
jgi:hypothetical protein